MHSQHSGMLEGIVCSSRTQEGFQTYGIPSRLPNNVWSHKSQQFPRQRERYASTRVWYRSLTLGLRSPLQSPGPTMMSCSTQTICAGLAAGPAGPSSSTTLWAVARSQAPFFGYLHGYWEEFHTFRGNFSRCCNSGQLDYIYKIFLLTHVARNKFVKPNSEVKNKVIGIFWQ